MISYYRKYFVFKLIILFLLLQFSSSFVDPHFELFAQTDQTCSENLEKAEEAYYDGEFNESINLISLCLKQSDITEDQRIYAYTILSRTFIAMDEIDKAKEFINKIMDINPDYLPTIEQEKPVYVNFVILVRKERGHETKATEESGISQWVWIGAGSAVAAATVIAIIVSGDENKDKQKNTLPEPPEFP